MIVSVIIPILKTRVDRTKRCIFSLKKQDRIPDEIITVVYKENVKTKDMLREYFPDVKQYETDRIDHLATAFNIGLKNARGDIICFTDDDCEVASDWIKRIEQAFGDDETLGGIGGRDIIIRNGIEQKSVNKRVVGKLTWYGRIIGNHHEGVGKAMEVDFLKGCNMSFKRELISHLDEYLVGFYLWEQDICFKIKKKDKRIIYDPDIKVKHFKESKGLINQAPTMKDFVAISHNTTYLLLKYLCWARKVIFIGYTFLIGQRNNPGLLRSFLLLLCSPSIRIFDLTLTCFCGKIEGIKSFFRS